MCLGRSGRLQEISSVAFIILISLVSLATAASAQSQATVALSASQNPAVYGSSVSYSLVVSAGTVPTGTVTLYDSGSPVGTAALDTTGSSTLTLSTLAAGTHLLSARYGGDGTYSSSTSATLTETITTTDPGLTIVSSDNPSAFGGTVQFTVTLASESTGTVAVQDGQAVLETDSIPIVGACSANGRHYACPSWSYIVEAPSLSAGTHIISAIYSGDRNFNPSTAGLTQVVSGTPAPPTIVVTPSAAQIPYDGSVTITAIVSTAASGGQNVPDTTASGSMTFTGDVDGDLAVVSVVQGVATFVTSSLSVGTSTMSAEYSGDGSHTPAQGVVPLSVVEANPSMVLGASPNPWIDSSSYTLSVTMPVDSTGTVTFLDGATVLGSSDILVDTECFGRTGCVSISAGASVTAELGSVIHNLVATYSGDSNYNSATSTVSLTVGSVSPGTGTSATITWAQPLPISYGTLLDSTELNAVLSVPGSCVYNPAAGTNLPAGMQTLSATCTPTDMTDYSALSGAVILTVNQAVPAIAVSSSANPSNVNQSVTFTASLPTDATGTVQFQVDGSNVGDPAVLSSGVASVSIATLVAGSHTVSAAYSGDANYLTSNGILTQIVNASVVLSPTVGSILPTAGIVGTVVTITGTSFGAAQGTSTVSFNGVMGEPTSWSDTQIVVPVPDGATTGSLIVTVAGLAANGGTFVVEAAYSYARAITIDHRQVSNTDQTNFPVLISGTFPYLATVANGGRVQNVNGYDIVFTSDAAGQVQLDHEIDNYNAATGTAAFWIRIPTLSHTMDTAIYVWYGNSAVVTSQENKPGVWQNGYAGVWHFGGSSLSANDSTANGNNGINHGVAAAAGLIGTAGSFDGTGATFLDVPSSSSFKPVGTLALEAWVKLNGPTSYPAIFSLDYRADGSWNYPFAAYDLQFSANSLSPDMIWASAGSQVAIYSSTSIAAAQWTHIVGSYDGRNRTIYVNGVPAATAPQTGTIDYGTSKDLSIGTHSPYNWGEAVNGLIDEARISTVARTADWIKTEYNNQSSSGTFAYVGPTEYAGTTPQPFSLTQPPTSMSYTRAITINHRQVSNSDQTDFPILISGTFPYLASATNGGHVQNASGYDIAFSSDAAGQMQLDHEIDSYNALTGTAAFWVRIPTLSHTIDTIVYIWYGNSAVVASQENKPGVWRNGYAAVYHLGNGSSVNAIDSTGMNNGTVLGVNASTGEVGGGGVFSTNSTTYLRIPSNSSFKPTAAITLEAWMNPASNSTWGKLIGLDYRADGSWSSPYLVYALQFFNSDQKLGFQLTSSPSNGPAFEGNSVIPLGAWTHVVGTWDNSSQQVSLYVNGAVDGTGTFNQSAIEYGTSQDLTIGARSPYSISNAEGFNGNLDEVRISSIRRSQDWIATEYNNQSAPGSFTSEGSESGSSNPIITGIVPGTASAGTPVVITGVHFGATQGAGAVTFNGLAAVVSSWSDTQLVVLVPSGATTGNAVITANGVASIGYSFTVPTVINSVSPSAGSAGTVVTIQGSGFGLSQNAGAVTFTGLAATPSSWSDTQIVAPIPSGTTTGHLIITVNGVVSNSVTFAVPVIITGVTPNTASAGSLVTVTGSGFGTLQNGSTVTFNGAAASPRNWSDTQILVPVPSGAMSGNAVVTAGGVASNGAAFGVPVIISALSPTSGVTSTPVTISGMGFGSVQGNSTVAFNGTIATSISWSDTQIVVPVPTGATSGSLIITVAGVASNSIAFTVGTGSYSYVRPIVVSHQGVVRSDQTDFPILISGTFPYLASAANGGHVQNVNGYDIVFTSDAAGQNTLDHEIDSYNPVTGTAAFWVKISLLSHTTDMTIYMWYGNSTVPASLENKPGVWQNSYAGVWHFGANGVLSTSDSTANQNNAVNYGITAVQGEIGGGGSANYRNNLVVPPSASFEPRTAITLETWLNPNGVNWDNDFQTVLSLSNNTINPCGQYGACAFSINLLDSSVPIPFISVNGDVNSNAISGSGIPPGQWTHLVGTYDGKNAVMYQNGLPTASETLTGNINYGATAGNPLYIATAMGGLIDEVRISTVARSADWIETEYNNQTAGVVDYGQGSSSTFVSICPEQSTGTQVISCNQPVPAASFSFVRSVAIDHIRVAGSDQTDFPVLISGVFPYLATVANGGRLQNQNGYDIVFTADAAGQVQLDHEIDSYDPVTGTAAFWIRIPLLSQSVDTTIYLWYSNGSVQVSQENKAGVWKNSYAAVYHFGSGGNLSVADSTANVNNGINYGLTASAGKIGGAAGTTFGNYLQVPSSASFMPGTSLTIETWLNRNPASYMWTNDSESVINLSNTTSNPCYSPCAYALYLGDQASPTPYLSVNGTNSGTAWGVGISLGQWVHLAGTYDSNNLILYENGLPVATQQLAGSINYGGSGVTDPLYIATATFGMVDEVRISTAARSAGWIATEYNNQSVPDHFSYICSEQNNTSSPAPCLLNQIAPPVISSLSPTSGPVGTAITITGTSFGATQGDSTLLLNGAPLTVTSWSDTQIAAIVPLTATSGAVTMQVDVWPGNSNQTFTVTAARLDRVTPSIGGAGDVVVLNGLGFLSSQLVNSVSFNGVYAPIVSWSNSSIIAIVPAAVTTGPVQVLVGGIASNSQTFTLSGIKIQALSPTLGEPGTTLTISGSGFGQTQGASSVVINNQPLTITSWSDGTIVGMVPFGAVTGSVYVSIGSSESNANLVFTVISPAINALSPTYGSIDTLVSISGSGFGITQGASTVLFNGVASQPTYWSDSQVVAPVPPSATTGPVIINANGLTSLSLTFNVVPLPSQSTGAVLTNSLGAQTTYTAANGAVIAISGPGCSSCTGHEAVSREYDNNGRITSASNALGYQTNYQYDTYGNAIVIAAQVDSSTSATTQFTYNANSQVLTSKDPLGNVTSYAYDVNGNLTSVTLPSPDGSSPSSVTQFTYDGNGHLLTITDPLGHATAMGYNSVGLVQSITDAQQNTTTYQYDARGNRTAVTDSMKNFTSFTYDMGDRLTGITYADETSSSFGYDYRGRRISATDQNGETTTYTYDDADRMTSVKDPAGNTSQYAYDTENNLVSISDANGNTTSFTYGADNRVEQTSFPSGFAESYVYDAVGNLSSKTDRKGQTITYAYDGLQRLLQKRYPDSTSVEYAYDLVGKVKQVNDPTGSYGFSYDNMGRLIGATTSYSFMAGQTFSNGYGYDAASNRTSFKSPDGSTVQYTYDTLNRLNNVSDSWAGSFGFSYDPLGRRTQLTRPNGISTTYQYDTLSRLLSVLHNGANDGATYSYDLAGNRISKQNVLTGISETYTYDLIYELTQVTQAVNTTESYSYDPAGNRLSSLLGQYAYNTSNELTAFASNSYAYDKNGNMLSKTNAGSVTSYVWDWESRLSSIALPSNTGTIGFRYDPFGRRIQKTSPNGVTIYLYDGQKIAAEISSTGSVMASYAQGAGIDEPLAMQRGGNAVYYHADALGSVTSFTNASAQTVATYVYDSFGNTTATEGISNSFRYTGREDDSARGLYYYRARYYDPTIGRFVSEDPLRFADLSNFYVYVHNRPVNATDPTGLWILICSRPGFQGSGGQGIGNHAYLYDTRNGHSCGRGDQSGLENPTSPGTVCRLVPGSDGHEDDVMHCCETERQHAGAWVPGWNDCHNTAGNCLTMNNLTNPGAPGGRLGCRGKCAVPTLDEMKSTD